MPRTKSSYESQYKYNAAHLKRVPLDMQLAEYDELKQAASQAGESVNGYIKRAIRERLDREVKEASTIAADAVQGESDRGDKFRWEDGDVKIMSGEEWERRQREKA